MKSDKKADMVRDLFMEIRVALSKCDRNCKILSSVIKKENGRLALTSLNSSVSHLTSWVNILEAVIDSEGPSGGHNG